MHSTVRRPFDGPAGQSSAEHSHCRRRERAPPPAVISCGTARRLHAQETSQEELRRPFKERPPAVTIARGRRDEENHRISHSRELPSLTRRQAADGGGHLCRRVRTDYCRLGGRKRRRDNGWPDKSSGHSATPRKTVDKTFGRSML